MTASQAAPSNGKKTAPRSAAKPVPRHRFLSSYDKTLLQDGVFTFDVTPSQEPRYQDMLWVGIVCALLGCVAVVFSKVLWAFALFVLAAVGFYRYGGKYRPAGHDVPYLFYVSAQGIVWRGLKFPVDAVEHVGLVNGMQAAPNDQKQSHPVLDRLMGGPFDRMVRGVCYGISMHSGGHDYMLAGGLDYRTGINLVNDVKACMAASHDASDELSGAPA